MKSIKVCAAFAIAGMLAACVQQEEPTMVAPQPVYDKFGGGECEGDWIYVPGSVPEFGECVPPEDCDPIFDSAGNIINCPPPRDRGPDDPDPSTRDPGRSATGGPIT